MSKIKITSKGQITLPKVLREKLVLREGDYLDVYIQNDSIVLKPAVERDQKEVIYKYCKTHGASEPDLEEARRILGKVPFSITERVGKNREED